MIKRIPSPYFYCSLSSVGQSGCLVSSGSSVRLGQRAQTKGLSMYISCCIFSFITKTKRKTETIILKAGNAKIQRYFKEGMDVYNEIFYINNNMVFNCNNKNFSFYNCSFVTDLLSDGLKKISLKEGDINFNQCNFFGVALEYL